MTRDAPQVWSNAALSRRWSCTGSGGALPEQRPAASIKRQSNWNRSLRRGPLGQTTPPGIDVLSDQRVNPGSIKPSPPHKSP
jgi:hypothetical protein